MTYVRLSHQLAFLLDHGVRLDEVLQRDRVIAEGSAELWDAAPQCNHDAVTSGHIAVTD